MKGLFTWLKKNWIHLLSGAVIVISVLEILLEFLPIHEKFDTTSKIFFTGLTLISIFCEIINYQFSKFVKENSNHDVTAKDAILSGEKEEHAHLMKRIEREHSEIKGLLKLKSVYNDIAKLPEDARVYYLKRLEDFEKKISPCIYEERSGRLHLKEYYAQLNMLADEIIADKKDCANVAYQGEVWAMTFLQEEELDPNDADYEGPWLQKLQAIDRQDINTIRLFVLNDHFGLLKSELTSFSEKEKAEKLLKKLLAYCSDDNELHSSFVVSRDAFGDEIEQEFIEKGKGFFATRLSNGNMKLIRWQSIDGYLGACSKCKELRRRGEIVFSQKQIQKIRDAWVEAKNSASVSLKEFLSDESKTSKQVRKLLEDLQGKGAVKEL